MVNGEAVLENIMERLNVHELSLRWKEGGEDALEELVGAEGRYSETATRILKDHHGVEDAFVVEIDACHRYVISHERPSAPERTIRRGRFRSWLRDAPIYAYNDWEEIARRPRLKLVVGGRDERARWLRSFPWLSYREKPACWWRVAAQVYDYHVVPNYYEPMEPTDIRDLKDYYPPPTQRATEEDFTIDSTGRVSFREAADALAYAEDLKRAMDERGVLCSPTVGIGGYTDLRPADDEAEAGEGPHTQGGLPRPKKIEEEMLVSRLLGLDYWKRRCAELERRLEDPNIPNRRKVEIERKLGYEREMERDYASRLKDTSQEQIYGLTLRMLHDRDRIASEKHI